MKYVSIFFLRYNNINGEKVQRKVAAGLPGPWGIKDALSDRYWLNENSSLDQYSFKSGVSLILV